MKIAYVDETLDLCDFFNRILGMKDYIPKYDEPM
jgi:hypothetical protein